jgi:endonuclease YncB( thermonuclease family)
MRLTISLALALALAACGGASSQAEDQSVIRADGRAIDGDTVSFDVRLYGADAFEKRQMCRNTDGCWPCGKAAQDYASKLLKSGNTTIRLTGKQSYGRPIGTIGVDGQDLGESMIAAGLAVPATSYLKDDPARAQRYVAAYEQAEARHAGVHAGYFIDPAKWRRGERLSCESPSRDRRRS